MKNYDWFSVFPVFSTLYPCPSFCFPDLRVSRPLIVPGYPENTTGVVGGQAKLVCKVHRPSSTKVQWLKTEVSAPAQSQEGPPRLRALTVRSWYIPKKIYCNLIFHFLLRLCFNSVLIILKSCWYDLPSMQALQSNAFKVNTLHLSNITVEDAGEYICMAESTHAGKTVQAMQSAWLDVLPGETHTYLTSFCAIVHFVEQFHPKFSKVPQERRP